MSEQKKSFPEFRDALQIIKTGKDSQGHSYNNFGTLNQAAWIGENAQLMLDRIDKLESALRCALAQDPAHWKDIGHEALKQ